MIHKISVLSSDGDNGECRAAIDQDSNPKINVGDIVRFDSKSWYVGTVIAGDYYYNIRKYKNVTTLWLIRAVLPKDSWLFVGDDGKKYIEIDTRKSGIKENYIIYSFKTPWRIISMDQGKTLKIQVKEMK